MSIDQDYYSQETATFGDRIAAARDAVGLGQSELAERLGVKLKTIVAWEDDIAEPRANKLQMLAGVLNVSMRWLLTGAGEGVQGPELENDLGANVNALLTEMRDLRGQASTLAERIGRVEKQLRAALKAEL